MTALAPNKIVLASTSPTRRRILAAAGVAFDAVPPAADEPRLKEDLRRRGTSPAAMARDLARAKAESVAGRYPGTIVVGSDQVLDLDGEALDKPPDLAAAAAQLELLSGRSHDQVSCVCAVRDGGVIWSHEGRATLRMRRLSDAFIARYLEDVGAAALNGPGAYQIEGLGAQLFESIDGDFFTVLGLPLLPLLDVLRKEGALIS